MLLKVMAANKFNIRANAWWMGSSSGGNTNPLTSIVSALISSEPGLSGGKLKPAGLTSMIRTPEGTLHFDLEVHHIRGKPPHVQRSIANTNPQTGIRFFNKDRVYTRNFTEQDLWIIKNYLKRQP